jgi:hypothetical protein
MGRYPWPLEEHCIDTYCMIATILVTTVILCCVGYVILIVLDARMVAHHITALREAEAEGRKVRSLHEMEADRKAAAAWEDVPEVIASDCAEAASMPIKPRAEGRPWETV